MKLVKIAQLIDDIDRFNNGTVNYLSSFTPEVFFFNRRSKIYRPAIDNLLEKILFVALNNLFFFVRFIHMGKLQKRKKKKVHVKFNRIQKQPQMTFIADSAGRHFTLRPSPFDFHTSFC